ncbi:hypothetical protein Glove_346g139 [Diversispora epigaea]|uniref:Peptidase S54 rhomboid domain-containing protein n=1 Tax=Diversispora epigaea TaxID=1348612 RepID=A0A397HEU1_9GLOM|nr:hypothetical protein Glove_346g139 [Diversispora epigaea]
MLDILIGREQFLAFYLTSGMMASCASHVISLKFKNWKNIRPSLGASGAIYACLSLVAVEFPEASVFLIFLPFFPIKIIHALPALIAFDIFGIISGKTIFDHVAHLSGALFGLYYSQYGKELYKEAAIALRKF